MPECDEPIEEPPGRDDRNRDPEKAKRALTGLSRSVGRYVHGETFEVEADKMEGSRPLPPIATRTETRL